MDRAVSRKEFLVGSAAAAVGLTAPIAAHADEGVLPSGVPGWDDEADVIVVGSGSGGAPAAVEAAAAGCDVLVVEKKDWLGGQQRRCAGMMIAAGTSVQEKLGVTDSADALYDYLVAGAGTFLDDEMAEMLRVFADNSGPNFEWLAFELGGQSLDDWDWSTPEDPSLLTYRPGLNISGTATYFEEFGMEPVYRCHNFKPNPDDPGVLDLDVHNERGYAYNWEESYEIPWNGGTGYWKPLEDAMNRSGVRTMMETTIERLITSAEGEVIGVVVNDLASSNPRYLKARKGVVVATGGFINDPEMVKSYMQQDVGVGIFGGADLSLPSECDGAGIRALLAIGAGTRMMGQTPVSCGGVHTNTKAQVIDQFGNVIPRVYAAGRTQGGLFGEFVRLGCGFQSATAICFGRIAGQQVAQLESWA